MKTCLVCRQKIRPAMEDCEPCRGADPQYSQYHKFKQIEVDKNFKEMKLSKVLNNKDFPLTEKQIETIKNRTKDEKYFLVGNYWSHHYPVLLRLSDNYVFVVRKSGALSFICKK